VFGSGADVTKAVINKFIRSNIMHIAQSLLDDEGQFGTVADKPAAPLFQVAQISNLTLHCMTAAR